MNWAYPNGHGLELSVDTSEACYPGAPPMGATFKCGHPREGDNVRRFKNGKWTGERCRTCSNADAVKRGRALRTAAAVGQSVDEQRVREIVREEMPRHHGCVCPAGAEKTCQGALCPRKPVL